MLNESADLVQTSILVQLSWYVTAKGALTVTGAIAEASATAEKSVPLTFTVDDKDMAVLGRASIKQVYSVTYSDGTASVAQNVTVMVNGSADGPLSTLNQLMPAQLITRQPSQNQSGRFRWCKSNVFRLRNQPC